MSSITIERISSVYIRIKSSQDVLMELSEHFTYFAPNYKHHPRFKARVWDGRLRLFKWREQCLYAGLTDEVLKWAEQREYTVEFLEPNDQNKRDLSSDGGYPTKKLNLRLKTPAKLEERPYQAEALAYCLDKKRGTIIVPTGGGKSYLAYRLVQNIDQRTLIIVPTVNLVKQMKADFIDYGCPPEYIHTISAGAETETEAPIVISTWQSIIRFPKEWLHQFNIVIGDEAHRCKAKSLIEILSNTPAEYRYGLTGTLDEEKANQILIQGLLGPSKKFVSTKELMDEKYLSELSIKAIILKHPKSARRELIKKSGGKKLQYDDEISYILSNKFRNKFIVQLSRKLKGNTLILFREIENHGDILHDMLKVNSEWPIFYIHGKIKDDVREDSRLLINTLERSTTLASIGTFAEGVNIPNLNNIIIVHPMKSKIKVLQAIGRVLRRTEQKTKCNLFDIADDLSGKTKPNHTLTHFIERIRYYNEEKFEYQQYSYEVKE